MKRSAYELTLTNMLADPMVRMVMAADHVDPQELATMLAAVAQTLRPAQDTVLMNCARYA